MIRTVLKYSRENSLEMSSIWNNIKKYKGMITIGIHLHLYSGASKAKHANRDVNCKLQQTRNKMSDWDEFLTFFSINFTLVSEI